MLCKNDEVIEIENERNREKMLRERIEAYRREQEEDGQQYYAPTRADTPAPPALSTGSPYSPTSPVHRLELSSNDGSSDDWNPHNSNKRRLITLDVIPPPKNKTK